MNNHTLPSSLTQSPPTNSLIFAQILSQTPNRIRLRVFPSPQRTERIKLLVADLETQSAVDRVRSNFHSGTITIFHHSRSFDSVNLLETLANLGLIITNTPPNSSQLTSQSSIAAASVTQVTKGLNQYIRQTSRGLFDLGFLVPLSFALLAWRQLSQKGWQFEMIPWYVLAWYAFDSFIKLQGINVSSEETTEQG